MINTSMQNRFNRAKAEPEIKLAAAELEELWNSHGQPELDRLKDVLRTHYRMFHIMDEFYDSVLPVKGGYVTMASTKVYTMCIQYVYKSAHFIYTKVRIISR